MSEEILPTGVAVPCGWGRLIFAHTFVDPRDVAERLLEEQAGSRDIAFYVTDPHIILNTAPRDLFMDPSDTYRIVFADHAPAPANNLVQIAPLASRDQLEAVNRIYQALRMVPVDADEVWANRDDPRMRYFVATSPASGEVVGVVLGVDHHEAFKDIENGSSLWSLAVDPQATIPGIGMALVSHVVEFFRARGRAQLDLSVLHTNTEAIALYGKLGFHRVPVFAIKRCNPINEKLFTGGGVPGNFNIYASIIIDEALRRGISIEPIHPEKGFFKLTLGGRSISCRESLSDLTSAVAMSRCDDKETTRTLCAAAGLSLPAQIRAGTTDENIAFLKEYGAVVVKPARGEQGQGVAVNLRSEAELAEAVEAARKFCDTVLIEEFASGEDLRIVVINYEVVAAAVRKPPEVVATGTHTMAQLIERASRRRAAATSGESTIPIDSETIRCIRESGFDLDSIPPADTTIRVRNTANLHTGGTIHDVTAKLNGELAAAAVKAAEVLEMPVVGHDFIVESVEEPRYWMIEANERPGLANHEPQPTAERFIDLLFPQTARSHQNGKPLR